MPAPRFLDILAADADPLIRDFETPANFFEGPRIMPINPDDFRRALGHFATGVTVVTACAENGSPAGITVSAFSSLSLEPPLVLICIDKKAYLHKFLSDGTPFVVNLLAADQEALSRRFASRDPDRFAGVGYSVSSLGAPLLNDVLATIECRSVAQHDGGDHTIFVGEVQSASVREGTPLLYFRGGYRELA